jgi:adenosine deaminase
VTENLLALQEAVALRPADVIQLQRNAIEIAWLPAATKGALNAEVDRYLAAPDP